MATIRQAPMFAIHRPAATRPVPIPVVRSLSSCGSLTRTTERRCASTPPPLVSRRRPTSRVSNLLYCTRALGSLFCWNAGRLAQASQCLFPRESSCSFWTAALSRAARSSRGCLGSDCRRARCCEPLRDGAAAKYGSNQVTLRVSREVRAAPRCAKKGSQRRAGDPPSASRPRISLLKAA